MPEQSKQGPVIVNAYCSFIKQLRYPGDVRVKHYVTDGRARPASTPSSRWSATTTPGTDLGRGRRAHGVDWISASNKSMPLPGLAARDRSSDVSPRCPAASSLFTSSGVVAAPTLRISRAR